ILPVRIVEVLATISRLQRALGLAGDLPGEACQVTGRRAVQAIPDTRDFLGLMVVIHPAMGGLQQGMGAVGQAPVKGGTSGQILSVPLRRAFKIVASGVVMGLQIKLVPPRRLIVTEPVLGAECRLLETVVLVDQEGFLTLEVFGSALVMITLIDTRQPKAMTVGRLPRGGCG